uniref:Signal transducer n=1 Tax=Mycena chlorophos TaxID=658473 RepID=A0ABQ0M2S6_MYCCL|nr:signal transducer [Mycena chlorophos]
MNPTPTPTQADLESRICPGCKRSAVSEEGGLVVAFGQSFFHVDCFKCAKCSNQVTADTNLLLLSDGSPICANCSYSCNVCKAPILDEAIMTGDDAYHAHCFKCKICSNRIEELVFAKTSQGIYCMNCHSARMAKIRKHQERKQREKAAQAARTQSSTGLAPEPPSTPHTPHTPRSRPRDGPYVSDAFVATPTEERPNPLSTPTLPVPPTDSTADPRRRSYDARRENSLPAPAGLSVSTSRQDRRRSINPGLTLNNIVPRTATPPPLSPGLSPPAGSSSPRASGSRPSSSSASPKTPPDTEHPQDQTVLMDPSSRPDIILDSVPPRKRVEDRVSLTADGRRPSIDRPSSQNGRTSTDSRRSRSERPSSGSRQADVPHSIESGTDTDDGDGNVSTDSPPPPPPKESKPSGLTASPKLAVSSLEDSDISIAYQLDSSDEMSESSPVERTSHSTYIAPALPPIRISMTTSDFAELFKASDDPKPRPLVEISEDLSDHVPTTPPPTATSIYSATDTLTPTSDATFTVDSHSTRATSEESTPAPRFVSPAPRLQSLGRAKALADEESAEAGRLRSSSESHTREPTTRVTLTRSGSATASLGSDDQSNVVVLRLREALADARDRGAQQLKFDRAFVEAILGAMEAKDAESSGLKSKLDGFKRQSKQYIDGLTVAQTEYDSELKARREAEAEVTRLRVLVSGQAARLTALSGDSRRQELRQQLTKELSDNLSDLEHDVSKLRVERDMALAEVEELSVTKQTPEAPPANLGRSLTMRLDTIKKQYQRDLIPLKEERENLAREIMELKGVRDVFLEETTVLNARNEELAQLSAQYARRMVPVPETPVKTPQATPMRPQHSAQQSTQFLNTMTPSGSGSSSASDDTHDSRLKIQRVDIDAPTPSKGRPVFKWPGSKASRETVAQPITDPPKPRSQSVHNFQQLSVLRFTRCDHCGDKMWGSQLRCTACNISVHVRCVNHVQVACSQYTNGAPPGDLPPSMFGRDLIEQVHADAVKGGDRQTPVIVDKCIEAVETLAMEYEGIYRKSGGSGQSKAITQLFERGDYDAFDLCDSDRFNDICSVTSVLKTYFRSLPIPLLTFELHEEFISAVQIKETTTKQRALLELVSQLPVEHFYTLRRLMIHLHRIHQRSEKNLMTARNLGVVFGPTLMRSPDPGAEFSDMAGKALSVEWFIENAPQIFSSA